MTKAIKGLDKTVIEMFKNCVEEEKDGQDIYSKMVQSLD